MAHPTDADAFGNWLAGFIDGEGSFLIDRIRYARGTLYRCQFQLNVRSDDASILHEIVERTGIGAISRQPGKDRRLTGGRRNKPSVRWYVHKKQGCQQLVDLLDRYPLRAKKAADYLIWREAVRWWNESVVLGRPGLGRNIATDWTPMSTWKAELEAGRVFVGASA